LLFTLQTLPALASGCATRGAGLFLLTLRSIYAGGPVIIKHRPGVRFAAAAAVFSVNYL
jgi:hypothetical protein